MRSRDSPQTGNTSNHHRYGEVKTRLTIGRLDNLRGITILFDGITWRSDHGNDGYQQGSSDDPKASPRPSGDCSPEAGSNSAAPPTAACVIEKADGHRPPSRFAKLRRCRWPGPDHGRIDGAPRGANRSDAGEFQRPAGYFHATPELVRTGRCAARRCGSSGPLLINDVIFAEVSTRFAMVEDFDTMLRESGHRPCSRSRAARSFSQARPPFSIATPAASAAACCRISSSAPTPRSNSFRF